MAEEKQVVVIGGGITGLSAAYFLQKEAKAKGIPLRIRLAERNDRLGGDVLTEVFDGHVIEKGPDSFIRRKVAAPNLCIELGLGDDLVGTNPANKKTYILNKGKLHRIPQGLSFGIPTEFVPFATTPLLSWPAKIRAGMELLIPKGKVTGDQSLGGFLAKRLGDEVVDKMAEPLLAGIYAGNSRNLSLRATFPHLEDLEQKHGSLIVGMLNQAKQIKQAQKRPPVAAKSETGNPPAAGSSGQTPKKELPKTMFMTLRGGLTQLVDKLVEVLGPEVVHSSASVKEIRESKQQGPKYQVILASGEIWDADAVLVTTPTFEAARMLPTSFEPKSILEKIPYTSTATVILGFDESEISYPLDGTGFVVPRMEGRSLTACTWISSKWMHTAPAGKVLMRCYVGRAGEEAIVEETDEVILRKVRKDLQDTMGVTADPYYVSITRWKKAMPQYTVGHLDRIEAFTKEAADRFPGVYFLGSGYTGLGVPDCIQQGKDAAGRALDLLAGILTPEYTTK